MRVKVTWRDFLCGPVAVTLCSQFRGPGFDPGSGNESPCAAAKASSALVACCHEDKAEDPKFHN